MNFASANGHAAGLVLDALASKQADVTVRYANGDSETGSAIDGGALTSGETFLYLTDTTGREWEIDMSRVATITIN